MEFVVKRKTNIYNIIGDSSVYGKKNVTGGLLLRKLKVIQSCEEIPLYEMAQKSLWKKFLINFLYFFYQTEAFPNYLIYCDGTEKGKTYGKFFPMGCLNLVINGEDYRLITKDNCICVKKKEMQIATIQKAYITYSNMPEYHIQHENTIDKSIVLLFVMYADTVFWPNKLRWNSMWSSMRWEKTIWAPSRNDP